MGEGAHCQARKGRLKEEAKSSRSGSHQRVTFFLGENFQSSSGGSRAWRDIHSRCDALEHLLITQQDGHASTRKFASQPSMYVS